MEYGEWRTVASRDRRGRKERRKTQTSVAGRAVPRNRCHTEPYSDHRRGRRRGIHLGRLRRRDRRRRRHVVVRSTSPHALARRKSG